MSAASILGVCAGSAGAADRATHDGTTVVLTTDSPIVGLMTRSTTATLTITTTSKPARVSISNASSPFTRRIGGRRIAEGATLRPLGPISIKGAEETSTGGVGFAYQNTCSSSVGAPDHGAGMDYQINELTVRARSRATIVYKYAVVGDVPWIDTNYSPRIVIGSLDKYIPARLRKPSKKWSVFAKDVTLTVPRPRLDVPIGGRVDLDFTPRPPYDGYEWGDLPAGKKLHLRGAIVPARAGYPIKLWTNRGKLLASLTTDANGRFAYAFTPRSGAVTRIRAEYPGMPGADLLPDSGCNVRLSVAAKRKAK